MTTPKRILIALILLIPFILPLGATASPSLPGELSQTPSSLDQDIPLNASTLEPFLDAFFAERLEAAHIPGATVVFVQNGEILLAKGYGFADLESQAPVDPAQTVFRAGSISKLFTATAIMQLVEQDKIDLSAPVSDYLPEIPLDSVYAQPVTTAHLLTHTGGFDERLTGMGSTTPEGLIPLGEYLTANMPTRVMPPGKYTSYSNHGFALAGLLVEKVSGLAFNEYITQNIFTPLGMVSSTFAEPASDGIQSHIATGYIYTNGTYQPLPLDYLNVAPAGSLYTTAPDIAQFMIAHLNNGGPLFSPDTAAEMHHQQFTQHPALPGFAYGFYEHFENGRRALQHGGDLTGFSSLLYLLPEDNVGFFVSVNTSLNPLGGADLRASLLSAFLDQFYPTPDEGPATTALADSNLTRFAGKYRYNRYARTTAEKGLPPSALLQITVRANDDGTLTTHPPLGQGEPIQWEPAGPLLFHQINGDDLMAFREDAEGNITHLFTTFSGIPIVTEKVSWYEGDTFQGGLLVGLLVTFLSAGIWPVSGLFRRLMKRETNFSQNEKRARQLAGMVSGLGLAFLIGIILRLGQVLVVVFAPVPAWFYIWLGLPLIILVLTAGLLWFTVKAWREGYWSFFGRVHFTLITLAAVSFIWFVNYWNLLGWRF